MAKFAFKREGGQGPISLTPEQFLERYFGKTEVCGTMLTNLEEFAPKLRVNFEALINYVNRGYRPKSVVHEQHTKEGEMPYIFLTMGLRSGSVELMLFSEGKLVTFLEELQDGKVSVGFNFNELMDFLNK